MIYANQSKKNQIEALEQLNVYDHICSVYETKEEQFSVIVPFIKTGLERGEKCIYVVNDNSAHEVQDAMQAGGVDTDSALKSGALNILNRQEYFLKQGSFEPDWMIQFLKEATDTAKSEGFNALRLTVEMTWFFGVDQGMERLVEFESKISILFSENDIVAICQYNRRHFTPEIILNTIHTHPTVIYGSLVCKNFYYIPPDEFLKPEQTSLEIDRLLNNIRTREQKELELKESEEILRKLTSAALDAIVMMDDKGKITFWNEAAEKMFGYQKEEVIGKDLHKLIVPERFYEDYSKGVKGFRESGAGGIIGKIISMYGLKKDGTELLAEHSFSSVNIQDKWQAICVIRDITERKRVDTKQKFTQFAVDNNADATYWVKSNARIFYVNKAGCQALGYSYEELICMRVPDIDPDFTDESWPEHWQEMKEAGTLNFEAHHKTKAGLVFPVEIQTTFLEYEGEEYICAFVRNITERKKAEKILQEQKKSLERKNIALGEVVEQIGYEKRKLKDDIIINIETLLLPTIQKLKISKESRKYVALLQKNLQELTSSFGAKLSEIGTKLTSREIEICDMVKNGLANKEIASLSNISLVTIKRHRANIRKKLGINNKDINLFSFLKAL